MNFLKNISLVFIFLNISICQRTITPEAKVFNQAKNSVFTVYGDRGHGSGFLFDSKGLVLTNQHVVAESKYIRVQLNDSTKVAAKILASNSITDIAVLYINPEIVKQLTPLTLAKQSDDMVYVGERVVAIGSPLNQKRILTSGIVSSIEETAIISDVNMNPGNSGGPLINMDYKVVGINTFGDFGNRGPGVYGSIILTEAKTVIEEALDQYINFTPPSTEKYPVDPKDMFPLEGLKEVIELESFNERPYRVNSYGSVGLSKYKLNVVTPPFEYFREKRVEKRLADKRKSREGNLSDNSSTYDLYKDLKNWAAYLGYYKPVVKFEIAPKIGQSTRSMVFNVLSAFTSTALDVQNTSIYEYEYKGDLYDFKVMKDSIYYEPIRREMLWQPLILSASVWRSHYVAEDLAQVGTFTFPIDLFQPEIQIIDDSVHVRLPNIKIEIFDIENPGIPIVVDFPEKAIRQVLVDFMPYTDDSILDDYFTKLKGSNYQKYSNPHVKMTKKDINRIIWTGGIIGGIVIAAAIIIPQIIDE